MERLDSNTTCGICFSFDLTLNMSGVNSQSKRTEPPTDHPKIASFSHIVKCLNSSKSQLFQELKKHPDLQVTLCIQNDTTNIKFHS